MKQKLIGLGMAIAMPVVSFMPRRVEANPAILAPAAFCAGTAGVGCVLIGTALVGGVVYYVWENTRTKDTVITDVNGEELEEPDEFGRIEIQENVTESKCERLRQAYQRKYGGEWRKSFASKENLPAISPPEMMDVPPAPPGAVKGRCFIQKMN